MSKTKTRYDWYPECGVAGCTITYKDKQFHGVASCHPQDQEFCSKLTGQVIAEYRASIELLKYMRKCEVKPQLKALQTLYTNMRTSKRFNPKSYESISLFRRIHFFEKQLDTINQEIVQINKELEEYIKIKDQDHKTIKAFREKKALAKDN